MGSFPRKDSFFDVSDYNDIKKNIGPIPYRIQNDIAAIVMNNLPPQYTACDICSGGAWLPLKLLQIRSDCKDFLLIDSSKNQHSIAQNNIFTNTDSSVVRFLSMDIADHLDFAGSFDLFLWSFAIHLFPPLAVRQIVGALRASSNKECELYILTFDKKNIGQSVFDVYLEGYRDIDCQRYYNLSELSALVCMEGWDCISITNFESKHSFFTVENAKDFFLSRPFSTFSILEKQVGEKELLCRIDDAIKRIQKDCSRGEVFFKQTSSLMRFKRCQC